MRRRRRGVVVVGGGGDGGGGGGGGEEEDEIVHLALPKHAHEAHDAEHGQAGHLRPAAGRQKRDEQLQVERRDCDEVHYVHHAGEVLAAVGAAQQPQRRLQGEYPNAGAWQALLAT